MILSKTNILHIFHWLFFFLIIIVNTFIVNAQDISSNFETPLNNSESNSSDEAALGDTLQKSAWERTLPPYPEPQPYAKNEQFFEFLNHAKMDMVADVKFDESIAVDFGLATGFNDKLNPGSLIGKHNPALAHLSLTRNACPYSFSKYWLRKVNQLRGRHQAPPLAVSPALSGNATALAAHFNAHQISPIYFKKPGIAYWEQRSAGPSVEKIFVHPESLVRLFYMKGAANYTSYGKEPLDSQLRINASHTFVDMVYSSSKLVGLGCLTQQTGVYSPLKQNILSVDTKVQIVVLYEHGNQPSTSVHYKRNVFPPGYYPWGKKVKIPSGDDDDDDDDEEEGKKFQN